MHEITDMDLHMGGVMVFASICWLLMELLITCSENLRGKVHRIALAEFNSAALTANAK